MRTLQVTGYIVADAERKIAKNGKEYITFRIANNEFNDEKGNDGKTKPFWLGVTSFNTRHFSMVQYLTKGKPIIVEGDYNDRIYQNKEGNCDISREIIANAIYFFPSISENGNTTNTSTESSKTDNAPKIQTKMETPKPTTADLVVPSQEPVNDDDDDDLPF